MPPLKDKKLKTESVSLKFSKLLPLVVKQEKFLNAHIFSFFNAFSPKAEQHPCFEEELQCDVSNFSKPTSKQVRGASKRPAEGSF